MNHQLQPTLESDSPQFDSSPGQNNLRVCGFPNPGYHSVEPILVVGGVLDHSYGTIGFGQRVLSSYHVVDASFSLLFAVASLRVAHAVLELVPRRRLFSKKQ